MSGKKQFIISLVLLKTIPGHGNGPVHSESAVPVVKDREFQQADPDHSSDQCPAYSESHDDSQASPETKFVFIQLGEHTVD